MPPIRAVLFDYGLVLTGPPDPTAWQHFKDLLSADEPAFHAAYWAHRNAYDNGSLTGPAYWHAVAADLHRTLIPDERNDLLATDITLWTVPNQPMIDWACSLPARGLKNGILSNIGDAMEAGILARCPWLGTFTHLTFSHRLHTAKPAPAIYLHAAAGLAEPPANILFVDDRAENIAAAQSVGMQAVQYTTHPAFLEAMRRANLSQLITQN